MSLKDAIIAKSAIICLGIIGAIALLTGNDNIALMITAALIALTKEI